MMLDAAIAYRRRGFSVAPIEPRGKKPLITWQRYQTEHAEPSEIQKWFTESPAANVGIVTGAISDLVVADIDTDEARVRLKKIIGDYELDGVPRSRTGKGWQLFFKHPGVSIQTEPVSSLAWMFAAMADMLSRRRLFTRTANNTSGKYH